MKKIVLTLFGTLLIGVYMFASCKKDISPIVETNEPAVSETESKIEETVTTEEIVTTVPEIKTTSESDETEETEETEETMGGAVTQAPGALELLADIPEADQSIVGQTQILRLADYYFIYLYNAETGEERLAVSLRSLCNSLSSYSVMTVYDVKLGGLEGLKAACSGEISGTVLATAGIGILDGLYLKNRIFSERDIDPKEVFCAKEEKAENPNALQYYFGGYDEAREDVFLKGNMTSESSSALRRDYDYARRVFFERFEILEQFDILSLNFGLADYVTWS